ncbi:MAG TPA: hypothetical protein VMW38_29645 [Terriglobia bacterium]|nr:hypothetical protein [Terriglobia bacterium]
MKKQVIQATLAVAVSIMLVVAVGSAQTPSRGSADIPFNFHVGNATLPAGPYQVNSGYPTTDSLSIRSKDGSKGAIVMTSAVAPMKADGTSKLVFNQYGSEYFLSEVWNPYDSIVRGVVKTKSEVEVARKVREGQITEVALKKR